MEAIIDTDMTRSRACSHLIVCSIFISVKLIVEIHLLRGIQQHIVNTRTA